LLSKRDLVGESSNHSRTERLWAYVGDVIKAIESHRFILGLMDGSLPMDSFEFYIVQDALYLKDFAKAILLISSKARSEEERDAFLSHVINISKVEDKLHTFFLKRWGIRLEEQEMSPVNKAYTTFLLSVAYSGSYPEALSTILPCYWVYMHIGKLLYKKGSPVEEYNRWISTYGGKEYEKGVKWLIGLVDNIEASRLEETKITENFRLATIYEYLFWDSAFRRETFPFRVKI
jgi:Putative transcription activator